MTTLVVWKATDESGGDEKIWMIADSKLSYDGETITDKCGKLFQITVRSFENDTQENKQINIGVAGHPAVAHNAVFILQYALSALIGPQPTLKDIVSFATKVMQQTFQEVALRLSTKAISEMIITGVSDNQLKAFSISCVDQSGQMITNEEGLVVFTSTELNDFPYSTGANKKEFLSKYFEEFTKVQDQSGFHELLPATIFDELFLDDATQDKTGGELQALEMNESGISTCVIPLRWNKDKETYERLLLGMKLPIEEAYVGEAYIAMSHLILNESEKGEE